MLSRDSFMSWMVYAIGLLQVNQSRSDFSWVHMNLPQHIVTSTTNLVWNTIWTLFLLMKKIGGILNSRRSQCSALQMHLELLTWGVMVHIENLVSGTNLTSYRVKHTFARAEMSWLFVDWSVVHTACAIV